MVATLFAHLFPRCSAAGAACALVAAVLAIYIGLRISGATGGHGATAYRAIIIAIEAVYGLVCLRYLSLTLASPSPSARPAAARLAGADGDAAVTTIICTAQATPSAEVLQAACSHLRAAEAVQVPLKLCVLPSSSTPPETLAATRRLLAAHVTNTIILDPHAITQECPDVEVAALAAATGGDNDPEQDALAAAAPKALGRQGCPGRNCKEECAHAAAEAPAVDARDAAAVDARALRTCLRAFAQELPMRGGVVCIAGPADAPQEGDYEMGLAKGCGHDWAPDVGVPCGVLPAGDAADVYGLQRELVCAWLIGACWCRQPIHRHVSFANIGSSSPLQPE
jgi:hypothetical protein